MHRYNSFAFKSCINISSQSFYTVLLKVVKYVYFLHQVFQTYLISITFQLLTSPQVRGPQYSGHVDRLIDQQKAIVLATLNALKKNKKILLVILAKQQLPIIIFIPEPT